MHHTGRSLPEFLRAWLTVMTPLAGLSTLGADVIAAGVVAAQTYAPPGLPAEVVSGQPDTFEHWQAIVLSQVADLADFDAAGPLPQWAGLGMAAPRRVDAVRFTSGYWYNFDPKTYLECAAAGAIGGWDAADKLRVPVPGDVDPAVPDDPDPYEPLGPLTWADLIRLAECGQQYE